MSADPFPGRTDPVAEFRRCWPLDMIVALDPASEEEAKGLLLGRWSDLAVADLPPSAQAVALASPPSWQSIAIALTEPDSLDYACDVFVGNIRRELLRRYGRERDAVISLARAGLITDTVPTLEELGQEWGLTRERVRQIAHDVRNEARASLPDLAPLRLVFGAHFALHPRTPLTIDRLASPDGARARILKLALEIIGLPQTSAPFPLWTETAAQRRAVEALIGALPDLLSSARSYAELAARAPLGHPWDHRQYRGGAFQGLIIRGSEDQRRCFRR